MTHPWILLALCLVVAPVSYAGDVDVKVESRDGELLVDLRVDGLFDEDVERALRSGLPARVGLAVELWADGGLWDHFVLDHRSDHRVVFDLLDESYDVVDDRGDFVLREATRDQVADWLQRIDDLPLCLLEDLESGRNHYVAVEVHLAPLTLEEMRDLERWLRGSLRRDEDESMLGRVSRQLFGVLKGRVGLGDRDVDGRSEHFDREGIAN